MWLDPKYKINVELALQMNLIKLFCPDCDSIISHDYSEYWRCDNPDCDYSCQIREDWI